MLFKRGTRLIAYRVLTFVVAGLVLIVGTAGAADIEVMISGGFAAAYRSLTPVFEAMTGHRLHTAWGPSMGDTPEAIPNRLARGEPADVLIMVGAALDELTNHGKVVADSRVDLARSKIGVVVRAGTSKPDISSVDAFRRALLQARSVAYSDSASGVYVAGVMFERLGIADQMKGKSRMIPGEPVGVVVARGDAEFGIQQISELLPVKGIDLVGPLPPELQKVTLYSAGIAVGATQPDAAGDLLRFLASPPASDAITNSGLEPATAN